MASGVDTHTHRHTYFGGKSDFLETAWFKKEGEPITEICGRSTPHYRIQQLLYENILNDTFRD